MKPSAREIIDSVAWALDHKVQPHVDDKWATSTLRSVHCLLLHLTVRVEHEGPMLFDDNADLREVLGKAVQRLEGAPDDWVGVRSDVEALLGREWRPAGSYPAVGSLNEENEALQEALDGILARLYRDGAGLDPAVGEELRSQLEEAVNRRVGREQPMFLPAFSENALY